MSECESVRGEWGGICPDCGQRLPARPRPWSEGRPCSRTSLERGRGWDGRPAVVHTDANKARWSSKPQRMPRGPSERLREIQRIVRKNRGSQADAARELGVSAAYVSVALKRIRMASA